MGLVLDAGQVVLPEGVVLIAVALSYVQIVHLHLSTMFVVVTGDSGESMSSGSFIVHV